MVRMLSGLLYLALLAAAIPVADAGAFLLPQPSIPQILEFQAATQQSMVVRLAPAEPGGEREYIDDTDKSDESSSANERTAECCASMIRSARSIFRTKLQHSAYTSRTPSLPIFYAFCTLLI
jgi:hypothetical protein